MLTVTTTRLPFEGPPHPLSRLPKHPDHCRRHLGVIDGLAKRFEFYAARPRSSATREQTCTFRRTDARIGVRTRTPLGT